MENTDDGKTIFMWASRPLDVMHAVSKQGTSSQNSTPRPRSKRRQETMKVVSIAILRTGPDVAEPIPVSMACELSSYGFFQRQVRTYNVATEFLGVAFFFVPEEILMADTVCVCVCVCRNGGLWRKGSQECGETFSIVHAQLTSVCVISCGAGRISPWVLLFLAIFGLSVRALSDLPGRTALCGRNGPGFIEQAANLSNY